MNNLLQFLCVLQVASKQLSDLQSELETLKEKNKQAEVNLLMEQGLSREKVCFQDYKFGNDPPLICR